MELEAHLFRRESARLVAALTRVFGVHNLALAEDVVQDAFCRALEVWRTRGVPENPSAWLTATAKHMHKHERDGRTRDQIRADLFVAWLTGHGTPTAVKTKVFVTVPVQLLAGEPVPVEQARIVELAARVVGQVVGRGVVLVFGHGAMLSACVGRQHTRCAALSRACARPRTRPGCPGRWRRPAPRSRRG